MEWYPSSCLLILSDSYDAWRQGERDTVSSHDWKGKISVLSMVSLYTCFRWWMLVMLPSTWLICPLYREENSFSSSRDGKGKLRHTIREQVLGENGDAWRRAIGCSLVQRSQQRSEVVDTALRRRSKNRRELILESECSSLLSILDGWTDNRDRCLLLHSPYALTTREQHIYESSCISISRL